MRCARHTRAAGVRSACCEGSEAVQSWASDAASAGVDPAWREKLSAPTLQESDPDVAAALARAWAGERLSLADGVRLFEHADLAAIARVADAHKRARYGSDVFFNRNLHVNPTNVCVLACRFCAFRRGPKAKDAYALDPATFIDRVRPHIDTIDEVHSVGGLHNTWTTATFETLFTAVKAEFPELHIKAMTAVEIKHLSQMDNISPQEVIRRLQAAGLDSMPGGGAEILDDRVRAIICKHKESSQEYLDIHRDAHSLGMPTNCTMLFGTVETIEERIMHLIRLRELQDETGGFQCFVPYPFLADNTRLPEAQLASGQEILRMIAISRLMLDNIPHIKAYRMNIGDFLAELALNHGADDIDGTVGHEEIMHEAGSATPLDHDRIQLARIIEDADCRPVQRNTIYTRFRRRDTDDDDQPPMVRLPIAQRS